MESSRIDRFYNCSNRFKPILKSSNSLGVKSAMKFRLFQLVILLATSGLLAPTQAAFGLIPARQMNKEKGRWVCVEQAQQLLCNVDSRRETLAIAHQGQSTISNQATTKESATAKSESSTVTIVPSIAMLPFSPPQQKLVAKTLIGLSYLLPGGLLLWILLSESYSAYRSATLRKQIELLERLWQSSSDYDASTDNGRGAES